MIDAPPEIVTLDNGFRIVLEPLAHTRTCAVALYVDYGSRDEQEHENGMTHFCEHLLFKGTSTMDWQRIARALNELGGRSNAWTSVDMVKLYASVIDSDVETAIDLLGAMMLDSTFPESEVERERGVILEEIAATEDNPEDLCFEEFTKALLLPHPVGRPIIGSPALVEGFTREALVAFWRERMAPERLLLSLAGAFDRGAVIAAARRLFGALSGPGIARRGMETMAPRSNRRLLERDLEQVNFCLGYPAPARQSRERFPWMVYDTILGGGMGSRLFDEVRERRGLAYSVGSALTSVHAGGWLTINCGTRPEHAITAMAICRDEVAKLAKDGPTASELAVARLQLERNHLLAYESLGVRCTANAERELYGLEFLDTQAVLDRLRAVTAEDVQRVARAVHDFGEPALSIVGPLEAAGIPNPE